jgi:two-component system chemotaxis response regulator CheB
MVGILLTGMGDDGARGLLALRRSGAITLAQDEASCVVYGMPRVAVELGAVDRVCPLGRMAETLLAATTPTRRLVSGD